MRENLSWPEAKRRAEELGGYLATITSAAEKSYLSSSVFNNNCCDYNWLGAEKVSGSWNWITGEDWSLYELVWRLGIELRSSLRLLLGSKPMEK